MPNNMGLYLTGAQLLANALALPRTLQAGRQEEATQRALMALASGQEMPAETMDAFRPPEGAAAKLMSGVGDVGAVLSSVLGSPVRAPRYDAGALMSLTKANAAQKGNEEIAAGFKKPQAQALARQGKHDAAIRVEQGMPMRGTGELAMLLQSNLDAGMDEGQARAKALEQYQERWRERNRFGGQTSLSTQIGAAGARDAIDRSREHDHFRADVGTFQRFGGQMPGQSAPAPAPQQLPPPAAVIPQSGAMAPAVQGDIIPAARTYIVADDGSIQQDTAAQPAGLGAPVGGTLQLPGGSTLKFAREGMGKEFDAIMRSLGVDSRSQDPADAERVIRAWQDYQREQLETKEAIQREAGTLPQTDRDAIVTMRLFQKNVARAFQEFTPEERARYTGALTFPARQWAQALQSDPKFAKWAALTGQIQAAMFGDAGKALTDIERQVVTQYVPQGAEWGGAQTFEAKGREFLTRADQLIRERLRLATTSPQQIRDTYERERGQFLPENVGKPGVQVPQGWTVQVR